MENLKRFINEDQNPTRLEKTLQNIHQLLTTDESISGIAVQKKLINISPDAIALTNKRIIICRPKKLGLTMKFDDFLWKQVAKCHLIEGVIGSRFEVLTVNKTLFTIDYLPKTQARMLYRYAQEQEERMIDYRREQHLENAQGASGGFVVNTSEINNKEHTATTTTPERLKTLKELHDKKLISQHEYDQKKADILKSL